MRSCRNGTDSETGENGSGPQMEIFRTGDRFLCVFDYPVTGKPCQQYVQPVYIFPVLEAGGVKKDEKEKNSVRRYYTVFFADWHRISGMAAGRQVCRYGKP